VKSLILCLFFAGTVTAGAWDEGGHQVVATIACDHLNPKAREAVDGFAKEMSSPGEPYDAVSLACWMDDIRHDTTMPFYGMFLSWHYINIGIEPGDPPVSFEPGTDTAEHGNVVQALKRALAVLKGGTDPYIPSKAMACAIVFHLVGDIHQPLHCATHYFYSGGALHQDLGGNKEDVINGPLNEPKFNLHAFWDSAWRASFDEASGRVVIDPSLQPAGPHDPESVRALAQSLESTPPALSTAIDIDQWARESTAVARDFVYPGLTMTESKKYCRLSSGYVAKANQLARERMVLAGWRLATLINAALGAGSTGQQ
jgi:hypothetical protein